MKSTVYSWRVSEERKAALERLARRQKRSVAELIDSAVVRLLQEDPGHEGDAELQRKLRRAAAPAIGRIAGGDPERATQARSRIREKLLRRRREPV
jgi:predicted transcriptional regulator